ncbi:MAG: hypothetical protein ACTSO7_18080 [Candidatus Heimdallarchaeota archaeon]
MLYQEVEKIKPSKIIKRKLGEIYQQIGNLTEAEKCFKEAEK